MRVLILLASVLHAASSALTRHSLCRTHSGTADVTEALAIGALPLIARDYAQKVLSLREPSQTLIGLAREQLRAGSQVRVRAFIRKDEQRLLVVAVRVAVADTDSCPCYSTASKAGAWPWTAY